MTTASIPGASRTHSRTFTVPMTFVAAQSLVRDSYADPMHVGSALVSFFLSWPPAAQECFQTCSAHSLHLSCYACEIIIRFNASTRLHHLNFQSVRRGPARW